MVASFCLVIVLTLMLAGAMQFPAVTPRRSFIKHVTPIAFGLVVSSVANAETSEEEVSFWFVVTCFPSAPLISNIHAIETSSGRINDCCFVNLLR